MSFQEARDRVWREIANATSLARVQLLIDYPDAPATCARSSPDDARRQQRLITAGLLRVRENAPKRLTVGSPFVAEFLTWLTAHVSRFGVKQLGTPANRLVLEALLQSNRTASNLRDLTGLSTTAIRLALQALEAADLLTPVAHSGRGKAWAVLDPTVVIEALNGGDLLAARAFPNHLDEFQRAMTERVGWPLWTAETVIEKRLILGTQNAPDATDPAWAALRRAYSERHLAPIEPPGTGEPQEGLTAPEARRLAALWSAIGDDALDAIASVPRPRDLRPSALYRADPPPRLADPTARCWGRGMWLYVATTARALRAPDAFDLHQMQLPATQWASLDPRTAATFNSERNELTINSQWPLLYAVLDPSDDHEAGRQLVRRFLQLRLIEHITTAEMHATGHGEPARTPDDVALTVLAIGSPADRAELRRRLARSNPTPLRTS